MGTRKGKEGVLKIEDIVVAEVKSFELTVTANEVDTSTMGSDWTGVDSTQNSWKVSTVMFYDPTDTGQAEIVVGAKVALELYSEGETTGLMFDSGTALVTSLGRPQSHDGMVERNVEFTGDGALTTAAVV